MVSPALSTSATRTSKARLPRCTGFPSSSRMRCAGNRRNAPKTKTTSSIGEWSLRVFGFIQAAENSRKRDHNNPPRGSAAQPRGRRPLTQLQTRLLHYFTTINATSHDATPNLQAINQREGDDKDECLHRKPNRVSIMAATRRLA